MRFLSTCISTWLVVTLATASYGKDTHELQQRQEASISGGAFPTLGSTSDPSETPATASSSSNASSSVSASAASSTIASDASASPSSSPTSTPSPTITLSKSTSMLPTSTAAPMNATSESQPAAAVVLPLQPHITPALGIGGVILIATGLAYNLVGIKNKWLHVSLSSAYLSSLSITVLIVYVMSPPVSNAVQGAYFVGIFMTGLIFGAGALIFKEITEGLGCLLGGFCLAMWFLTLKSGGLITSTTGKGVFIAIFCALAWGLSFSQYTRTYGLIGSTSFSGATVFILGVDCFSQGGLKEFWLYIWALNSNLFPLNTDTYPITRGTRVETIIIILVALIGVISQMKLWKVVQERKKKKLLAMEEDARRRDVVEAALGRHLERQNDRDRSVWEKQYGNRLTAKRDTILWADAHGEKKRTSRVQDSELGAGDRSSSSDSLELLNMPRQPRSMYVAKVVRNSSALAINAIPEGEEGEVTTDAVEQQKSLNKLEGRKTMAHIDMLPLDRSATEKPGIERMASAESLPQKRTSRLSGLFQPRPKSMADIVAQPASTYLAAPNEQDQQKRRSIGSWFAKSSKEISPSGRNTPNMSSSQEALVVPPTNLHHSRASSLAATVDFDNEIFDLQAEENQSAVQKPPEIVISASEKWTLSHSDAVDGMSASEMVPPSPPALQEQFEEDPEELVRLANTDQPKPQPSGISSKVGTRKQPGNVSEGRYNAVAEEVQTAHTVTTDSAQSETLTKGLLQQLPSQLSNVVLSYRTNEWAKHASTAEAPIYDEPAVLQEDVMEPAAHLALTDSAEDHKQVVEPPALPDSDRPLITPVIEAAKPSDSDGITVNVATKTSTATPDDQTPAVKVDVVSSKSAAPVAAPRGLRSSSTPLLKQNVTTSPIDENAVMDFVPLSGQRTVSVQAISRASSLAEDTRNPRSQSRSSQAGANSAMPQRASTAGAIYQQLQPTRSDTRLASYDSHQPQRTTQARESQQAQARENMLAEWRLSQQRMPTQGVKSEVHRQQMIMQKQYSQAVAEQQRQVQQQQELAHDVRMRAPDMQQLHREAMRRMQAGVNKNMRE